MSHARNHRLRVLAEKSAQDNQFGDTRPDASVYHLQLIELKNDKSVLSGVKSEQLKAEAKAKIIPKHMPYVEGVMAGDRKVDDEIVTTIMLWCFDAGMFEQGLKIAEFALKHELQMPDSFSRDTPSIVAEEIANAALTKIKAGESFDLDVMISALNMTEKYDMHDQIRAKLNCAIGKMYLTEQHYSPAIFYMKKAIELQSNVGCKQDLNQAERLLAKQLQEENQEQSPVNPS